MTRRLDSSFNALIALLILTAIVQTVTAFRASPSATSSTSMVDAPVGERVSMMIQGGGLETSTALRDVAPGTCRYIVLYSPTCGASATLARQWAQDLAVPGNLPVPPGWTTFWVSPTGWSSPDSPFPAPSGIATYYQVPGGGAQGSVLVRAVPAHMVLDRTGRVVEAGIGAPLLTHERYGEDCVIRDTGERTDGTGLR